KSNIRIKMSESTFYYSNERKKEQYANTKNVIAFNIDISFLIDYGGNEYDIYSGKMAKKGDHDKIMRDKAKLNRESKDDLD
ncbi:hypothetical protein BJV82DRAFT_486571, partial [Fennellomyces sp. T-0311]